ncbi:MAG: serine hydrolase [Candidatus Thorarchaeota archaeon]|nr:serine hydrolase [Candidatus Thorarchaeota archaeon]
MSSRSLRHRSISLLLLIFILGIMMMPNLMVVSATQQESRDYWPTDEWEFATPESKGMNSSRLNEMLSIVTDEDLPLHSLLIVKDGYIIMEEYPRSTFSSNTTHLLYSTTKSITSVLVGVAMFQGYLDNVSQKVLDFFPERTFDNVDSRKEAMTVEHLLTMTPGIEWDEWIVPYSNPSNVYRQMMSSSDPVQFVLDREMIRNPGDVWTYCGGASHLLSTIVNVTTGMNTLQFAQENLFGPIGIPRAYWGDDSLGVNIGGSELSLRPRDMARIGYLYLNNGTWDGQQIVSTDWITASTETAMTLSNYRGYGYQWWTYPNIEAYFSTGLYGQQIIVVPEHDLVVVVTGGFIDQPSPYYEFLINYIIPAAEDDISVNSGPDLNSLLVPIVAGVIVIPIIVVAILRYRKKGASA